MGRGSGKNLRGVDGVLLLDKPRGITSNQALQRVKRLLRARKAGHTGSLDPLATGLLPLCFGEATKVSSYLLEADKHYTTVTRLGSVTSTGDAEGEVVEESPVPELTESFVEGVLARFRGDIKQVPPMYSALHHNGKRLYELAQKGITVERPPRDVCISRLELTSLRETSLTLKVACSKGTYIRSLVEDIGKALGCGAHVEQLRRTGVEPFVTPVLHTLPELESLLESQGERALDSLLLPPDEALQNWKCVALTEGQSGWMRHGRSIPWEGSETGSVRIYDDRGVFMGLGEVQLGELKPKRLLAGAVT